MPYSNVIGWAMNFVLQRRGYGLFQWPIVTHESVALSRSIAFSMSFAMVLKTKKQVCMYSFIYPWVYLMTCSFHCIVGTCIQAKG